jgi:PEGA domain-containing protein
MVAVLASPDSPHAAGFRDGFGERSVVTDAATGQRVQLLRLPQTFTDTPTVEFALRQRCTRLATFRHTSYVRVCRIDRGNAVVPALVMVSEHVEGTRLSELLLLAETRQLTVDISTALAVVAELLTAVADLERHAPDLASGLIAPERIILGRRGRVAIAEQALGAAVERLYYDRDRLWQEFRVATDVVDRYAPFTHRTDVFSVGLVALALILGRPLGDADFPDRLLPLLDRARERSTLGYERPLSPPLRAWLVRALQLDRNRSFATASEACAAFTRMVSTDPLYFASPLTLEIFRETCAVALTALSYEPRVAPDHGRISAGERGATVIATDRSTACPAPPEPIHVTMLPPPAAGPAHSEAIDWTAIADQRTAVATTRDIDQLFAEADPPPFADAVGGRGPAPTVTDALDFSQLDRIPDLLDRRALSGAPPQQNSGAANQWPGPQRAAALHRSGRLRKPAVALLIFGLLAGGTTWTRALGRSRAAAWEMGTLLVQTKPNGLQVFVDGIERGLTPLRLPVRVGEHLLEVRGISVRRQFPVTIASGVEFLQSLEFETIPQQSSHQAGSETPRQNVDVGTTGKGASVRVPIDQRRTARPSSPAGAKRRIVRQ